jgi:hypothetical protein
MMRINPALPVFDNQPEFITGFELLRCARMHVQAVFIAVQQAAVVAA